MKKESCSTVIDRKSGRGNSCGASGILLKILHPAGAVVKVGESIGLIGETGEKVDLVTPGAECPPSAAPAPPPGRRERGDLKYRRWP